jgi:hypothetical protein
MRRQLYSPQTAPTHRSHLSCYLFIKVRRMSRNYIGIPRSQECSLRPLPTRSTLSRPFPYRSCLLLHWIRHGLVDSTFTAMFMHLQPAAHPVFVCFTDILKCYNLRALYLLVGPPKLALLVLLCSSQPSPNSLYISSGHGTVREGSPFITINTLIFRFSSRYTPMFIPPIIAIIIFPTFAFPRTSSSPSPPIP